MPEPPSSCLRRTEDGRQKKDEEVSHDKIFGKAFQLFLKSWVELLHPMLAPTLDLDNVEFLTDLPTWRIRPFGTRSRRGRLRSQYYAPLPR